MLRTRFTHQVAEESVEADCLRKNVALKQEGNNYFAEERYAERLKAPQVAA